MEWKIANQSTNQPNQPASELIPCMRVLPEKLTVPHPVKKFPAFYWTRRFITEFTRIRNLSVISARSIQSTLPQITSWRSILLLTSHLRLGLQSVSFPRVYPPNPRMHFSSPPYVPHAPPISFDPICQIILGEGHTDHEAPHLAISSSPLSPIPSQFHTSSTDTVWNPVRLYKPQGALWSDLAPHPPTATGRPSNSHWPGIGTRQLLLYMWQLAVTRQHPRQIQLQYTYFSKRLYGLSSQIMILYRPTVVCVTTNGFYQ